MFYKGYEIVASLNTDFIWTLDSDNSIGEPYEIEKPKMELLTHFIVLLEGEIVKNAPVSKDINEIKTYIDNIHDYTVSIYMNSDEYLLDSLLDIQKQLDSNALPYIPRKSIQNNIEDLIDTLKTRTEEDKTK